MVGNIHRHLDGRKPDEARQHAHASQTEVVLYAAKEWRPIVFGIFIIIVVSLAAVHAGGIRGKMFSPLAFTISFALLGSLIPSSLTLVPMLARVPETTPQEREPFTSAGSRTLSGAVETVLCAIRGSCHPGGAGTGGGARTGACAFGTEFSATLDEGAVSISFARLPSISLPQSIELAGRVERSGQTIPRSD